MHNTGLAPGGYPDKPYVIAFPEGLIDGYRRVVPHDKVGVRMEAQCLHDILGSSPLGKIEIQVLAAAPHFDFHAPAKGGRAYTLFARRPD